MMEQCLTNEAFLNTVDDSLGPAQTLSPGKLFWVQLRQNIESPGL